MTTLRPFHELLADLAKGAPVSPLEENLALRLHQAVQSILTIHPEHREIVGQTLASLAAELAAPDRQKRRRPVSVRRPRDGGG